MVRFLQFPRTWMAEHRLFRKRSLDRLSTHLERTGDIPMTRHTIEAPAGEPIMILTRTFDAPLALVWKAVSEPQHVVAWFGPHGHKNRVLAFDFRVGGEWRIETTTGTGQVIVFFGEFRAIAAPHRLVQTFSFDGLPPGVHSIEDLTLSEENGKTVYRTVSTFPDVASRDGMLASGMEVGVMEGFQRLDAMLDDWKAMR